MNFTSWLLWGFNATVVLTILLAGSQGLGLTRMSIPYMLGTLVTPGRDRALLLGSFIHFVNGWIFSLLYVLIFQAWHDASWWRGAGIGLVHALFILTLGMSILPPLHPRMASDRAGPTAARQLEPPGFLALNYGVRTPIFVVLSHVVFGMILGGFYRIAP